MPVKSHKTPPKPPEARERKGKGFTSHGRRMVRNGAWWLQKEVGRDCLSFLTCTLPDEVLEIFAIAEDAAGLWAEIIRQFEQWLKRRLSAAGLCDFIVGVTEVQEKRWVNYGKVGLHLHWVFQGRANRKSAWLIKKEEFANAWSRIISNVLERKVEGSSATRIERVKKSVENYLAKYMSKGGRIIEQIIEEGKRELLPSSWWNVSHGLRTIIKSLTVKPSDESRDLLIENWKEYLRQGILSFADVYKVAGRESHGEEIEGGIPVCLYGKFASIEHMNMFI